MKKLKAIACVFFGHSKIIFTCLGYVHCARCDAQIGDALGGCFDGSSSVIVDHDCEMCRTNWSKMTWKDRILVKYKLKPSALLIKD